VVGRLASFLVALFLFVLAIQLMKDGAKVVAPTIQGSRLFANGFSTLGAGWLGAYVVLSGSPVAAVSLGLFAGGALTKLQTFTMLSGSRLGASFVVLLVGFLYAIRNPARSRGESVGMGILALSLTAIVYLPGMLLGYTLLKTGMLDGIRWSASKDALSLIDVVWGPALNLLENNLPGWLLLPLGLAAILVSFKFLDRILPAVDGERAAGRRVRWLKRTWPMFFLGCLVATLTLSVSVALTVLVPLASRGYVKREEAMPYIMGANITTLADTLVAAMLTGHAVAVHIVLAEALGVSLVTVVYLAFLYGPIKRRVLAVNDWVIGTDRRLWLFVATIFVMPLLLMLSGAVIGPLGS
jgi:Na+/phosphate symporter